MKIKIFISILLTAIACRLKAQQLAMVKDTSFSIEASYTKELKKRPYIQIASPLLQKNVVVQKNIVYKKINERSLLLDVYYPQNNSIKNPAVLLIFGGGWSSGDKTHNMAMATYLANNGFVAVSAEYRLSGEAIFPAAVQDLNAAIQWMKTKALLYEIDTTKIAVLGCSAGGQLASLIGTTCKKALFQDKSSTLTTSTSIQAVVNIDGVLAFRHPESSEGKVAAKWLGGTYEEATQNWLAASALNHTDSLTVPFLFINSSTPRFHAGRDDMISKMKQYNIYYEVHELPDTPHTFWFFHPWFNYTMQTITNFLQKHL